MDAPVRLSANAVEPHSHAAAISNGVNVKTERQFERPNPSQPRSWCSAKRNCSARASSTSS